MQGFQSGWDGYFSSLNIENFVIQNNIMSSCTFYPNNNTVAFNLADNAGFGDQNGNQQNINMGTVFLYTGSTDGQYQLKEGSPAIGAGAGGSDCGVFAGGNPYVLSGLPPIPAVYDFMVGGSGSQYNVNMKVKSHN